MRRSLADVWARRGDPRLLVQLALVALCAAAVSAFGWVVEDYLTDDPLVQWDVEFSRWLHDHSSPTLVSAFDVVTLAGNVALLALLTAGVALYLLRRGRPSEAAFLCLGALGIELLNPILKLVFHRPRPELAYVHLETYSFPSGHAAGAAAVYALALYLLAKHARTRWQIVAAAGFVVLVALIGFSRLYLEVHYLSDVLAGTALGAAWASACLFLYESRPDLALRVLPGRLRRLAMKLSASGSGSGASS
ncbi:MAG TPA: phosphatase PAP2 family protein [Gaiellaceae bacterium]|nr:phosphatase PAP2 family protein [Gaiellaceae bacterium]